MSEENALVPPADETPAPQTVENAEISPSPSSPPAEIPASSSPPSTLATTTVKHKTCGKLTDLGKNLAASHRNNPGLYTSLPCHHHGVNSAVNFPVAEFTWGDDTPFSAN